MAHLVLFDGCHNGAFQKAVVRSAQREPMFNTDELKLRNEALFHHVNCTADHNQLSCFRTLSEAQLVNDSWSFSTVLGTEGRPIKADFVTRYQSVLTICSAASSKARFSATKEALALLWTG